MKLLFGLVLLLSLASGIHAASTTPQASPSATEQKADEGTPAALGPPQTSTAVDHSTNITPNFKQDAALTTTTVAPKPSSPTSQNNNASAAATEVGATAAATAISNKTATPEVPTQAPTSTLNTVIINSGNDSTSINDNKTDSATTEIKPTTLAPAENSTGTNPGPPATDGGRHFDLTSFVGGILLCFTIAAVIFLAVKCFGKKKDYQQM